MTYVFALRLFYLFVASIGIVINGAAIYAIYKIVKPTRGLLAYQNSILNSQASKSSHLRGRRTKALSEATPKPLSPNSLSDASRRHSEFPFSRKQSQAWNKASFKLISINRQITPNLRYVWCLAVVDMIHCFITVAQFIIIEITDKSTNYSFTSCLNFLINSIFSMIHCLILLTLSTIALDLYFGIVHWRWYNTLFLSNRTTIKVILFNIITSILIGSSQLILPKMPRLEIKDNFTYCESQWIDNHFTNSHATSGLLIFATVLIITAYSIASIYAWKLHRSSKKNSLRGSFRKRLFSSFGNSNISAQDEGSTYTEEKFQDRYIRGLTTTSFLMLCFIGSFMPSLILDSFLIVKANNSLLNDIKSALYLPLVSSCLNPILYAFRDPQVRKSGKENFKFFFLRSSCHGQNGNGIYRRSPSDKSLYRKLLRTSSNYISEEIQDSVEIPIRRKLTHAKLEKGCILNSSRESESLESNSLCSTPSPCGLGHKVSFNIDSEHLNLDDNNLSCNFNNLSSSSRKSRVKFFGIE